MKQRKVASSDLLSSAWKCTVARATVRVDSVNACVNSVNGVDRVKYGYQTKAYANAHHFNFLLIYYETTFFVLFNLNLINS